MEHTKTSIAVDLSADQDKMSDVIVNWSQRKSSGCTQNKETKTLKGACKSQCNFFVGESDHDQPILFKKRGQAEINSSIDEFLKCPSNSVANCSAKFDKSDKETNEISSVNVTVEGLSNLCSRDCEQANASANFLSKASSLIHDSRSVNKVGIINSTIHSKSLSEAQENINSNISNTADCSFSLSPSGVDQQKQFLFEYDIEQLKTSIEASLSPTHGRSPCAHSMSNGHSESVTLDDININVVKKSNVNGLTEPKFLNEIQIEKFAKENISHSCSSLNSLDDQNGSGESFSSSSTSLPSQQHKNEFEVSQKESDVSDGSVGSDDSFDEDTCESYASESSNIPFRNVENGDEKEKPFVKYPIQCEICSKEFFYRAEFIRHYSTHDNADESLFLQYAELPSPAKPDEDGLSFHCEICGKGFTHKQAVKHHYVIHTDERPHTCNICKKSYRHRSALYKHKRSHTDVLAYSCDICGKRFKHKSYLNIHLVVHTQQRPYSCNICGSTFRDRSARNKHLHAHTGERPYSCEVCGKCFGRKGDYKSHSVIHTEQRPYKCEVCGRGFRSSSNYHRHSRIHTSDCPYKCETCGKSFNQNWKLKEHKFVHSDTLPYLCDVCGSGFKYPRKYKQHMENHARERLHSQEATSSCNQKEGELIEVLNVQPDISLLLEQ